MAFVHQNGDAMPTMVARHALSGGQTPRASMALWQLEAGGSRGARQSALGAAISRALARREDDGGAGGRLR